MGGAATIPPLHERQQQDSNLSENQRSWTDNLASAYMFLYG